MSNIQETIDKVKYLYPKAQYPDQKSEWDIGHRCLSYFEQTLPLSRILLPWYLLQKLYQEHCQMPTPIHKTPQSIRDICAAMTLGEVQLKQLRHEKKDTMATPHLIKKYKVANCQELSDIAYRWLTKQGKRCYCVECCFEDNQGTNLKCTHILLLYRKDNKVQSFQNLIRNLNDPNVQILDMLFQRCGSAYDMLNALSMESVCMIDDEKARPLKRGDVLYLWNQNWAKEVNLEHFNLYRVGRIQSGLFKQKRLVLNSKVINKDTKRLSECLRLLGDKMRLTRE